MIAQQKVMYSINAALDRLRSSLHRQLLASNHDQARLIRIPFGMAEAHTIVANPTTSLRKPIETVSYILEPATYSTYSSWLESSLDYA
jgi:hypothetical protein